ncbi:hypothetical protein DEA8626_00135 [Defluviimonas aquaemixtae]|uniref:Protein ImuA n=1 Tax=Albidovulum aquaemixtae TaxID=1542388 RepID=A0A2R8B256_9RHOB|nr:hypothetical protein [Defluviimonas aquaemixtae]SPH16625.1 hypothetical protein DEA8626_00135 [Defluviimonas aquaemixtae]
MQVAAPPHFPPRAGRAHEVCGAGALFFAFVAVGLSGGPVLWVREGWQADRINPLGYASYCDPDRLLLASGKDQTEVLAVTEEALRSGAVSFVVAEIGKPLSLVAGRRLQLAAEAGKAAGLCIIPEGMGSNAAETRWHCQPAFDPRDSTLQRWKLIKNKSGTLGAWDVRWDAEARRVIVVSETAQRPGSEGAPG